MFRRSRNEDDEAKIEIITSSSGISVPKKTPAAENDQSSLKQKLYMCALRDRWYEAKSIYDEYPDIVRIPLTGSGDTALHVAVSANRSNFVQMLVHLMNPEDLEIRNADGKTAFDMATITGSSEILKIMIEKNNNLAVIHGFDGMLPVHLAALSGHHKIVQELIVPNLLERMASNFMDIERLFFMTISGSMYDVAVKLLEINPAHLAVARDEEQLTALHMLARNHSEKNYIREDNKKEASSGWGHQLQLLNKLWSQVRQLEYNKILELITKPSVVLVDAVKSGNDEAVKWILYTNRELLMIKDSNGRNLLHYVVLYRRSRIFNFILKMETVDILLHAVDKDRNNVLHFAADQPEESSNNMSNIQMQRKLECLKSEEASSDTISTILRMHRNLACHKPRDASPGLISTIQMKRELAWFQMVKKRVPHQLRTMRNSDGKTPTDIFDDKLKTFSNEVKDEAKGIAKSAMVVAALIINVVFPATLTVPGDKTDAWFVVFIFTNTVALLTSSVCLISFLSIFTARLTKSKFIISLYSSLIHGLLLLFISIISMIVAFAAASFLTFDHISKWAAYVVASVGLLAILKFLQLQCSLLDDLLPEILSMIQIKSNELRTNAGK